MYFGAETIANRDLQQKMAEPRKRPWAPKKGGSSDAADADDVPWTTGIEMVELAVQHIALTNECAGSSGRSTAPAPTT